MVASEHEIERPDGRGLLPIPPRTTLVDPKLDLQLREDGYASFPLLSRDEVDALRDCFGRLQGWQGDPGIFIDFAVDDYDYRRQSAAALSEVIDPHIARVFRDFRPFLHGFRCKWPGGPALDLHVDWTCVDERLGHRAYLVWVALDDIEGDLGSFAVLPGSHRVDPSPRGSGVSIPLPDAWATREREIEAHLVEVPAPCGSAVVFDLGVVHLSYANVSSRPRLAAAVGAHPHEAGLVYYRRDSVDIVARYDVDAQFFAQTSAMRLGEQAPPLAPAEMLELCAIPRRDSAVAAYFDGYTGA